MAGRRGRKPVVLRNGSVVAQHLGDGLVELIQGAGKRGLPSAAFWTQVTVKYWEPAQFLDLVGVAEGLILNERRVGIPM